MTSESATAMLDRLCSHIHNYFADRADICRGSFAIIDGALDVVCLAPGQYYRVRGSAFNDGVHRHPADDLIDEIFTGEIWPMKPPVDALDLAETIAAWQAKYGDAGPYQSESFGGYSYTRSGDADGWQAAFKARLDPYRKLG